MQRYFVLTKNSIWKPLFSHFRYRCRVCKHFLISLRYRSKVAMFVMLLINCSWLFKDVRYFFVMFSRWINLVRYWKKKILFLGIDHSMAFLHYEKVEKRHAFITGILSRYGLYCSVSIYVMSSMFSISYAIFHAPQPSDWILPLGLRWVNGIGGFLLVEWSNSTKILGKSVESSKFSWNISKNSWKIEIFTR